MHVWIAGAGGLPHLANTKECGSCRWPILRPWPSPVPTATRSSCASRCARPSVAAEHGEAPIGAVVVRDGEVLAAAGNERELRADPTAHAEILALRAAAAAARRVADSGLDALRDAGALRDVRRRDRPRPGSAGRLRRRRPEGGRGGERARRARRAAAQPPPEVEAGLLAAESAALLRDVLRSRRQAVRRPACDAVAQAPDRETALHAPTRDRRVLARARLHRRRVRDRDDPAGGRDRFPDLADTDSVGELADALNDGAGASSASSSASR